MTEEKKVPSFEDLTIERLRVADPSVLARLGLFASRHLQKSGSVCLTSDALGRIRIVQQDNFVVKVKPRIEDQVLHQLNEEQAIHVLKIQEDTEEMIVDYLKRRDLEGVAESGRQDL